MTAKKENKLQQDGKSSKFQILMIKRDMLHNNAVGACIEKSV